LLFNDIYQGIAILYSRVIFLSARSYPPSNKMDEEGGSMVLVLVLGSYIVVLVTILKEGENKVCVYFFVQISTCPLVLVLNIGELCVHT
jgi:hypothetical protein